MTIDRFVDAYHILKNNVNFSTGPLEFLTLVYDSLEEILSAREENREIILDEETFYSVAILQNYFFNNKEKYERVFSVVRHYLNKSQQYFNEDDLSLIEKISDMFSFGKFDFYIYIPYLAELVRRYDGELFDSFAGIMLWVFIELINNHSIPSHKTQLNILQKIVEQHSKIQRYDGDEKSEIGKILLFVLNKENINNYFETESSIFKANFFSTFEINGNALGLNDVQSKVLILRTTTPLSEKYTLENVGNLLGFTRERARQIQAKAKKKICSSNNNIVKEGYNLIENIFYSKKNTNPLPYFTFNEFNKFLSIYDNDTQNYLYCILNYYKNANIVVNYDFEIIYDRNIFNLNYEINKIKTDLDFYVSKEDFNNFDMLKQNLIKKNYNIRKNSDGFFQKGFTQTMAIEEIFKKYFEHGYRINESKKNKDYLKMLDLLKNNYDIDTSKTSPRSIIGTIIRTNNIYLAGKGLYKHAVHCVTLPKELTDKIILFIENSESTIKYKGIFDRFKKELTSFGIDNHYYLKGLLDKKLPNDYITKRDYIKTNKSPSTFKENVISDLLNKKGTFTFNDIIQKYPGIKDYQLQNYINEIGSIIYLGNKIYINIDQLNMQDSDNIYLKEEIKKLFKQLNSKYISANKLYVKIKINNPEFFKKYSHLDNSFALFSYINIVFSDTLYFRRPLIAIEENENMTTMSIIKDYLSSLDSFDNKSVDRYVNKMNIRQIYSYLELMIDMSDDYIQVNMSKMVKKNLFNINEKFLNELKKSLNYYLNSFGSINTKSYKGYSVLPKISIKWNKYLLVGIVRTYLSNEFEIENTDTTYTTTDFIIRRY